MKTVVIGLDGATFDLILPWVKENKLPNLGKLVNQGSWGRLFSGAVPHSAIAWPSFSTGKNLGKHGIYDFYVMATEGNKNSAKHVSSKDCQQEYLWETISRQQKRSVVINVPMTYPPSKVNGVFISGFQTPYGAKDYVYPQSCWDEVEEVSGGYQILPESVSPETSLPEFFKGAKETLYRQFKVVKHFLKKGDWDFFMYVFREIDPVEHFFWKYLDKSHPDFEENEKFKSAIFDYYKIIDDCLGQIFQIIDKDTCLMIMSDHGMGPRINSFHLNNWLMQEGYLKLKNNFKGIMRKIGLKLNICESDLFNFFIKSSPISMIRKLFTGKETEKKTRYFYKFSDIDWSRTKAYNLGINQIAINLKGREPEGIVEKGNECQSLIKELIEKLNLIKDPFTGERLCTNIYRKKDVFKGKVLGNLPDLILECSNYRCIAQGGYKINSSRLFSKHSSHSGGHYPDGIFAIYGDRVKKGKELRELDITDVAPTVLSVMGLGIPKDYDGKIVKSAFESEGLLEEKYIEPVQKNKEAKKYTKEENEAIEERLKSLGYL